MENSIGLHRRHRKILQHDGGTHCPREASAHIAAEAEMTLELRKCRLFTDTIDNLGYVIQTRRQEIASNTTDAIR